MHRDIKSDNVMVGSDGAVKLIDFGVSAKVRMSNQNRDWLSVPIRMQSWTEVHPNMQ